MRASRALQDAFLPPIPMRADGWRLFFLGLLASLQGTALIRWLSGSVQGLGVSPDLVLPAVLAGSGAGFVLHPLLSEEDSANVYLAGFAVLAMLAAGAGLLRDAAVGWVLLAPAALAAAACLSQRAAKVFGLFRPLMACSIGTSGLVAGLLASAAAGMLGAPPWVWFAALVPLHWGAAPEGGTHRRVFAAALLGGAAFLVCRIDGLPSPRSETVWSPYERIELVSDPDGGVRVSAEGLERRRLLDAEGLRGGDHQLPYDDRAERVRLPPYRSVLILGAGAGNDAAAALLNGAERVTAVEPDPVLARLGRTVHPWQPYEDARVRVVAGDGRAFMSGTESGYNLVLFTRSHPRVRVSALSQLRMDSCLFTVEAVRQAWGLLSGTGDLFFRVRCPRPWLAHRLKRLVYEATGRWPRTVLERGELRVLAVGRAPDAGEPPPETLAETDLPTDDWPFFRLRKRGMPRAYVLVLAALAASVLLLLSVFGRADDGEGPALRAAFVCMGAGFMLLTARSVVQSGLLFGATRLCTSSAAAAALVLILAADWTALLFRNKKLLRLAAVLLAASCLLSFLLPASGLAAVRSLSLRLLLASLLVLPAVFFAALVFAAAFRGQRPHERLFGWTLLGGAIGTAAEYAATAVGYGVLALAAAALYGLGCLLFVLGERDETA